MRRTSGLVLLLTIMLNHAVLACDAMVMHLPEHDHSYTSLCHNHTAVDSNAEHSDVAEGEDDHSHPQHAHVSCHIAYYPRQYSAAANADAVTTCIRAFNSIHYQPPVPPPNTRT